MINKRNVRPKSRAVLSLIVLATFVALLFIHAFTMHVHIDDFGHIVVHSHVMPMGTAKTENNQHSHSYLQLHWLAYWLDQLDGIICLASFLLFIFITFSSLAFIFNFSFLQPHFTSLSLRAPPQFSF